MSSKLRSDLFARVVDGAVAADPSMAVMRPAIEKEVLHYDIIRALSDAGLFSGLTFQGGTCLRLCHGASRLSEDLDFTGGKGFDHRSLELVKRSVEEVIGRNYGLPVEVKEPRDAALEPVNGGIRISKWQVAVITAPARPDMPRQRIKIEVADIPSETRQLTPLKANYAGLPASMTGTLVPAQTLGEILADKVVSLPNCSQYVRNRDVWDIGWLVQRGARIDPEHVRAKVGHYDASEYGDRVRDMLDRVDEIVSGKDFLSEMARFIPANVRARTLDVPGFGEALSGMVRGALEEGMAAHRGADSSPSFMM